MNAIDNSVTVCECAIIVNIILRVDQSMYFVSEMRGTMFIDCSSWKSSLHAYGIFREEMCPDDRQKWHLHIARERIRLSCIISSIGAHEPLDNRPFTTEKEGQ